MVYLSLTKNLNDTVNIIFDHPQRSANFIDMTFLSELEHFLSVCEQDASIRGLKFSSKKNDFLLGEDLAMLASLASPEKATELCLRMNAVFARISQLKIPTVAAIDGICQGAGLELALACRWRVVTKRALLGFGQVKLGYPPMADACTRLPDLIGLQPALDLLLSSRQIDAAKALKIGLIDTITLPYLLESEAAHFAVRIKPKTPPLPQRLPRWAVEGNLIGRRMVYKKYSDLIEEKTKEALPAAYKTLEAVFDTLDLKPTKRWEHMARIFSDQLFSRQCQSLIHLFLASPKNFLWQETGRQANQEVSAWAPDPYQPIAILGAGAVGSGIAVICADKNIRIRLWDDNLESLGQALGYAQSFFAKKQERRQISADERQDAMLRISCDSQNSGLRQASIIIEAGGEDLDTKLKLLKNSDHLRHPDSVYASVSGSISPSLLAKNSCDQSSVIGIQFFAPLEKSKLLEVVLLESTSIRAKETILTFADRLGLYSLLVKDSPGFFVTRIQTFFLAEALSIFESGASPIEGIDQAMESFGFRLGPLALIDETGIHTTLQVFSNLSQAFANRLSLPSLLNSLRSSGRLGKKNRRGFYLYSNDNKPTPDLMIEKDFSRKIGQNQKLSPDKIVERCLMALINETVACLREGVITSAQEGDLGAVFGLGFPSAWGGPFHYIDFLGIKNVVATLDSLQNEYGPRFEADPLLLQMLRDDLTFYSKSPSSN